MKNKKKIILIVMLILVFIAGVVSVYMYFSNPNRLTSEEKKFLANQSSNVQSINVINNVSVFGDTGTGVFYDFINDFSKKYNLKTNNVAVSVNDSPSGLTFNSANILLENDVVFYTSHYVLIGKNSDFISKQKGLLNKNIGILSSNLDYVNSYLDVDNVRFKTYSSDTELLNKFKAQSEIQYMMVPLHLYLNEILVNDYFVVGHFEDIPYYFKISAKDNQILGSIMKKYYNTWKEDTLQKYYLKHLFDLFVKSLKLSVANIDDMRSITYKYGFVDNKPYEIFSGGKYDGIAAQYLREFMTFSDVDIKFSKYKTLAKFNTAIQTNKMDMYFGFYDINSNYSLVHSDIGIPYSILAHKKNDIVIQSLKSLSNKTVYVLENSSLYSYLKNNTQINVKTYKNSSELKKVINRKEIIIVDTNVYLANLKSYPNYSERYQTSLDADYTFRLSTNETFTKLFTKYSNIKSPNEAIYKGTYNYDLTLRAGTLTGTIAQYFLYILGILVVAFLYFYKISKKVKLSRKIKKEDKLKYIDQLTSLKNRNYLSENLENWSQNTIFPQAIVVIDLNNLQVINDTMGYEQGDVQIKGAANILVKSQLDNSDIIRTDGNEFVIYLVGYHIKQVTSYIHKLNKEFKKLPFDYGAAIGYSMIEDKIKSVEDAINEAVEDVKKQKEKRDKKEEINEN